MKHREWMEYKTFENASKNDNANCMALQCKYLELIGQERCTNNSNFIFIHILIKILSPPKKKGQKKKPTKNP